MSPNSSPANNPGRPLIPMILRALDVTGGCSRAEQQCEDSRSLCNQGQPISNGICHQVLVCLSMYPDGG
jgi:hypothetical protein